MEKIRINIVLKRFPICCSKSHFTSENTGKYNGFLHRRCITAHNRAYVLVLQGSKPSSMSLIIHDIRGDDAPLMQRTHDIFECKMQWEDSIVHFAAFHTYIPGTE